MKLNWGTGIGAVYIFFMIGVLIMVAIFMNQDVSLETKDYYSKGIAYQNEIDKLNRTKELPEQLQINLDKDKVVFQFPQLFDSKILSGKIYFYRPSNSGMDFHSPIALDSNLTQSISTVSLEKGLWKIKTDWNVNSTEYFTEKIIMIN